MVVTQSRKSNARKGVYHVVVSHLLNGNNDEIISLNEIKQSINQSINQSLNQSINKSINQSLN